MDWLDLNFDFNGSHQEETKASLDDRTATSSVKELTVEELCLLEDKEMEFLLRDLSSEDLIGGPSLQQVAAKTPDVATSHVAEQQEAVTDILIQNVVCTVSLGCKVDLRFIASKGQNVEYNPATHNSLIMRIRKPHTTAMVYGSGSLICVGAKSVEQSRIAARKYARIIQKLGFPVHLKGWQVQNIVASCETFPVNLEQLKAAHPMKCNYEPEMFPGASYKVRPGLTVTIHASGKIHFTGAKEEADLHEAFNTIYPLLMCVRTRTLSKPQGPKTTRARYKPTYNGPAGNQSGPSSSSLHQKEPQNLTWDCNTAHPSQSWWGPFYPSLLPGGPDGKGMWGTREPPPTVVSGTMR